jgi:hypothetical protein
VDLYRSTFLFLLCAVGWLIQLYPWFQYTHQMRALKFTCQIGNMTPLLGVLAWYMRDFWQNSGQQGLSLVPHDRDVHGVILWQVVVY